MVLSGIVSELYDALENGILKRWYPLVVDSECGGYYTNLAYNWEILPNQEKMIVTQARHIWALSKVSTFLGGVPEYDAMAYHGYKFLVDKMWDHTYGGFYQIRSREGTPTDVWGWHDEKRVYGNAFGLFALSALTQRVDDFRIIDFARSVFQWIEENAYDPLYGGYFQFFTPQSLPFDKTSQYKTKANDRDEVGYKDQNSSIHLLEAYTELYHVWNDPFLGTQLQRLLELIRDRIVTPKGYLQLFFERDWKPVSFRTSSPDTQRNYYALDHVSFGHDYETAFLLLEASYALKLKDDCKTLIVAKKLLDHALRYGWDHSVGGFYDGGYYFAGSNSCAIVKETKTWWVQAEGLNALLLFSRIFPDEKQYEEYFHRLWEYIKNYILDKEYGDWFEGGLDKEPHHRFSQKSHIWKCTYHTLRALMNCINLLKNDRSTTIVKVAEYWKNVASYCEV
ncbi:MAG: AGE family epimerase/isomerase [Bacteroidetes bacterium]|nr:AGE family epimerase/isomerase [Bacteroidota bacterium]